MMYPLLWVIIDCNISRNIRRIRKFLSVESTKLSVHALVTSRMDYCSSLLYGLPQIQQSKLQRVQNTAARPICNTSRFDHISPVLFQLYLHWLPVHFRIIFKGLVITYKVIYGMAPIYYISGLITIRTRSDFEKHLTMKNCDKTFLKIIFRLKNC